MRILYVVSLFPCWSETFIVREIDALLGIGADVRIFSLKHPVEKLVQLDARRLQNRVIYPASIGLSILNVITALIRAPLKNIHLLGLILRKLIQKPGSMFKSVVVLWRSLATLKEIATWRPDMIHAHWATYPSTSAMILAKNLNIPFSFTSHAHDIFLENQLLDKKLEYAAFAVTISEYNRRYLAETVSASLEQKLHVVHCGVDLDAIPYSRSQRTQSLLLSVGRLDEIKGFPILLQACKHLKDRGIDYRCEIIGEGPLRPLLEQQWKELGLEQYVSLLGAWPQERIQSKMLEAMVFVLPSIVAKNGNRDGIPVVLMEAMASGTPVITTRVSGIPEIVKDGYSGFLTNPGDYEELVSKIELLLTDKHQQEFFARNARAVIEMDFVASKECIRLYQLFKGTIMKSYV